MDKLEEIFYKTAMVLLTFSMVLLCVMAIISAAHTIVTGHTECFKQMYNGSSLGGNTP